MMRKGFYFLLFLATGCSRQPLQVDTQFVSRYNLPSTYVATPDPRQQNPPIGQKLWIYWRYSKKQLALPAVLKVHIISRDFSRDVKAYPVFKASGSTTYDVLNQNFVKTRGVLAYKVQMETIEGAVKSVYKHPLWFEPVEFDLGKEG